MRTIDEVMGATVIACSAMERLGPVRERMVQAGIECLPVLDDHGAVCGIVTATDLLERPDPGEAVQAAMTTPVITIDPSTTTVQAAETMLRHRLHHLVVVAGGLPRGVISSFDLLRVLAGELDGIDRPASS